MTSSISAIAPVQNANPKLASTGRDNGDRQDTTARDRETFQSVMAEKSRADKQARIDDKRQRSDNDSAKPHDSETGRATRASENAHGETPDDIYNEAPEDLNSSELEVADSPTDQPDFNETEVSPSSDIEANANATEEVDVASITETGSRERRTSDGAVPPWLSAAQGTEAIPGKNSPNGIASPTLQPGAAAAAQAQELVLASTNPRDVQVPGTGHGTATSQTGDVSDAKGNSSVPVNNGNANLAALANAPGQTAREGKLPEHVVARREVANEGSTPLTSQPAIKTPNTTPPPAAQAALMQNPAIPQEKSAGGGDTRWLGEASFSADAAISEMPATSRSQQATLLQQPDLPRNVAVQIAQAMRQGGADRPMELVLNPAELGRVRISMQAGDGAMTVHVLAERPETLDLMRRHIDLLAQEFHDIGYGSADFAFGQNTPEGDGSSNTGSGTELRSSGPGTSDPGNEDLPDTPAPLSIHSDRVDIRL